MSNLAKQILEQFNDTEKQEIKSWAEEAIVIRGDSSLSSTDKMKRLYGISWKSSVISKFFKASFKYIKNLGWDDRSLPAKLAITGATIGLSTVGGKFVGLASAGFGASLPFFVLTSAGGALLGVIIQEVNEKK